jgi:hypothetical protein
MGAQSQSAISNRFAEYLQRLSVSEAALAQATTRTTLIQGALLRSVQISRAVRVGSLYKATAIRGISDLDFFVVLRREDVRWGESYKASSTILNSVRAAIRDRFPSSDIGRDGSAVRVTFANGIGIDVVPAMFDSALPSGHPMYSIPDGEGAWLLTAPDAQRLFFQRADAKSGGKLSRAVQLVKAWSQYRMSPLPLSSFYVESALAAAEAAARVRTYSAVVGECFRVLAGRGATALRDPLGISGLIHPTRTEAQGEMVAASLDVASYHADAAYEAELNGNTREAIRQWRIVLPGFRDY